MFFSHASERKFFMTNFLEMFKSALDADAGLTAEVTSFYLEVMYNAYLALTSTSIPFYGDRTFPPISYNQLIRPLGYTLDMIRK